MKIIVGLGNPGSKYRDNRHSVGFRCIDRISAQHSIPVKKRICQSDTGRGELGGQDVLLVKPRTFVNLSGQAVVCLMDKFRCDPADVFVIHDDLDLPTGRLRLRLGGRPAGHRGIKSIIDCIESQDFMRIRIGISRPEAAGSRRENEEAVIEYVLSDFPPDEKKLIDQAVKAAAEAIECILSEGMTAAMNKYNKGTKKE